MDLYTETFLFFGIHSSYVGWDPSPLTPFQCVFEVHKLYDSGTFLRGTWEGGPSGGTIEGHYISGESLVFDKDENCRSIHFDLHRGANGLWYGRCTYDTYQGFVTGVLCRYDPQKQDYDPLLS